MDECITKEMTKSLLKAFEGINESLEDFQKACASTIESTEKHIVSALFLRESAMLIKLAESSFVTRWYYKHKYREAKYHRIKAERFSIKISSNMLGAIIGDIVGSRFEFNNTDNYNFELFTKDSTFTDDTICTIAVADAINTGANYKDKFLQWCRAYPNPKGAYGGSFARWIASDTPQPYNSFGNGSAMRVSPVAWAYDNLDKVLMEAEKTAIVTHNHPEGVKGAVAVAHAIYYLRTTHNQKVYENIMQSYYPQFMVNDYYAGIFDETCQGTVPLCLKIIRVSTSFEDAIRRAISWGGDSDTIGAIVGSMAEALWGIPDSFIWNALRILPDDMRNVIGCFYNTKIEVI